MSERKPGHAGKGRRNPGGGAGKLRRVERMLARGMNRDGTKWREA